MPPPLLKPETKAALQDALKALAALLEVAELQAASRKQDRDRAVVKLEQAQTDLDALKAKRRALRQDLGEDA